MILLSACQEKESPIPEELPFSLEVKWMLGQDQNAMSNLSLFGLPQTSLNPVTETWHLPVQATDSLKLSPYVFSLDDVNTQNRIFTNQADLTENLGLTIDSVYGDFTLRIFHEQSREIRSEPLSFYTLNAEIQGEANQSELLLSLENHNYAYVIVYSDANPITQVSINDSPIPDFENQYYFTYLDTRSNPFDLEINLDNGQLVNHQLTDLVGNNRYRVYIENNAQSYQASIEIDSGFVSPYIDIAIDPNSKVNLVTNGDFEQEWLDNFTPYAWTIADEVSLETLDVFQGGSAAKQLGGTHSLAQVIEVSPETSYLFSFYYKVLEGDSSDGRIWCSFHDQDGLELSEVRLETTYLEMPEGFGSWNYYEQEISAPLGATSFHLELRTYTGATIIWDNISLVE